MAEDPDGADDREAELLLIDRIKSAILDQLIDDIRHGVTYGTAGSHYAKSDSGLYGKYQKADAPDIAVLNAIKANLQSMVDEALVRAQPDFGSAAAPAQRPKKGL